MSMDDPLIGKKLGDYTIQSLLGRGGMSRVYKGYDENLQRYAAVKVISGDFATTTEEEYTKRFTSEARAIAHLRHPSIVGVYQFGRTEGIYYMAQVFLEGQDLRHLLKASAERGQRISGDEITRIVKDVAEALDYAHALGVIHRDVKPSNIMLEKRTNRAILMDFGLALSVHEGTMGDTFGSAHYIAPEQAVSSAKAVPQSDLYSLGIVIYEMVTGKVPFDDPSVMSVALKHLNELPPPPSLFNPDLPRGVETVIMRALDKDPTRRYPTGQELVQELEKAFAGQPVADPEPPAKKPDLAVDNGFLAHPTPQVRTASQPSKPSKLDSELGGFAARLVRRRARREEDAAHESMTEDELEIDNDTLGSLLNNMPDPSDIGLVGSEARGVTPRPQSYADSSPSRPIARMLGADESASQIRPPEEKPTRRSRLGVILPVLLVLVVLIGAVYFGPKLMDNDGGDNDGDNNGISETDAAATLNAEAEQTALAAIALTTTATHTVTNTVEPTTEPTTEPTREPTLKPTTDTAAVTQTAQAVAQVTDAEPPTQPATEPTIEPTLEPTKEPTREPTTDSAALTATASALATDTATESATETPTASATAEATETATVESTPVAVAMVDASAIYKPNIRLIYDNDELLLLNISGDTLDISQLVFAQTLPSGETLEFATTTWEGLEDPPEAMRTASCYQLLTSDAPQELPAPNVCSQFQGYFRSLTPDRYFWISDEPGAEFTVQIAGSSAAAATCDIAVGECEFYAGLEADAELIEPTPTIAVYNETPNIRLVYDAETFVLVNISDVYLDISKLVFEQELPSGTVRLFLTAEWDDRNLVGSTTSLRPSGCYELVTTAGTWYRPENDVCDSFLGWFRSNTSDRYFWRGSQPNASFIVRYQDSRTPFAQCAVGAGECSFYMPPEEDVAG